MKVRIQCPHCNKVISIPTEYAGKRGKCPSCGQVFQIPASLAPPPSQPTPPSNVYDAEDAGSGLPPLSDSAGMNSDPFGNAGMNHAGAGDNLGYGLSNDLLDEINRQPSIPVSQQPEEPVRIPCPVCKEPIVQGAAKCHHCGEIFDLVMKAHEKHRMSKRRGSGDDALTTFDILLIIFCGNIACILGVIWMIEGKPKGAKMVKICIILQLLGLAFFFLMLLFGGALQQM